MVPPSFSQLCALIADGSPTPMPTIRSNDEPEGASRSRIVSGLPANFDTFTALSITFAGSAFSAEMPNLGPAAASSTARPSLGLALRVKETSILGIATPQDLGDLRRAGDLLGFDRKRKSRLRFS